MKRKVIYLLAVICCISAVGSAKQIARNAPLTSCIERESDACPKSNSGFELSPLYFFVLSI